MPDKIIIIDYNMGNVKSVANMLRKIGAVSLVTKKLEVIDSAEKIILPGVGSFDAGMRSIHDSGLTTLLNKKILSDKIPVLGICLGMQLFADKSEEGVLPGLGWIEGDVKKFRFDKAAFNELKIPHMGWNHVTPCKDSTLFCNVRQPMRFYFVHSYHYVCACDEHVAGKTTYGEEFTCAVHKDNIYGVQFHPEKSHTFGMQVLENFVEFA